MAAGRFNFTIEQGTTVDFEIQYQDASGNPIDLAQHYLRVMTQMMELVLTYKVLVDWMLINHCHQVV